MATARLPCRASAVKETLPEPWTVVQTQRRRAELHYFSLGASEAFKACAEFGYPQ